MPAGPRDNLCPSQTPPGFTDSNVIFKNVQIIELLQQVIHRYQNEPDLVETQSKQTDLLVVIAQLALLPTTVSTDVKQEFLNRIVTIGHDLIVSEEQVNINANLFSKIDSSPALTENTDASSPATILSSITSNNNDDAEFSLDDLASEYLQNEPSPTSLNENTTTPSESSESDLTLDSLSKEFLSISPSTVILSSIVLPSSLSEPILVKSPLESILFSNRLSSHDAADDADKIWKDQSSPFGQIYCKKSLESPIKVTKRISTCLLDHSLYERLTRLIDLLPKQCANKNVQQLPIRRHGQHQQSQQHRPMRSNHDNSRFMRRPTFQQNFSQAHSTQHYPAASSPRQYANSNYSNSPGNPGGHFVDRRQQQHQQQSNNRFSAPTIFTQQAGDYFTQQKRGPKNNSYGNSGQQSNPNHQQQGKQNPSNNYNQPRDTRKPGGGNK